jgi:tetratricopeptide (TPR) repeat protein
MSNDAQPVALTNSAGSNLLIRWWRSPNVRFLFVALASSGSTYWMTHWPPGGSMNVGPSPGQLAWGIGYAFFPGLLTIFFGAWGIKLLFQIILGSSQTHPEPTPAELEQVSTSPDKTGNTARNLTALYLVGIGILLLAAWGLRELTHIGPPNFATSASNSVLLGLLTIGLIFYAFRKRAPAQTSRRTMPSGVTVLIGVAIILIVSFFAMPWARRDSIFWVGVVALFQLYFVGRYYLVHWIWASVRHAQYAAALRRQKICSWFPGFPKALEGEILFESGRYDEAEKLLKNTAFDHAGSPRLSTPDLCAYAQVTAALGDARYASELLNAAVLVPQRSGAVQMALAELLLETGRDVSRAKSLVQEVVQRWKPHGSKPFHKWLIAHRAAVLAWAHALSHEHTDAERELHWALANLEIVASRDIAYVQLLAGHTFLALGKPQEARNAFLEASKRDPHGHHGKQALNKLHRIES